MYIVLFNFKDSKVGIGSYCKNPKALETMREFIILPSNRLIR